MTIEEKIKKSWENCLKSITCELDEAIQQKKTNGTIKISLHPKGTIEQLHEFRDNVIKEIKNRKLELTASQDYFTMQAKEVLSSEDQPYEKKFEYIEIYVWKKP
jgi:hypothetical protein